MIDSSVTRRVTEGSFRIPISTELFPLCPIIGEAIWLLAFYIDRTTSEAKKPETCVIEGIVAGGNVVQDVEAAKSLCVSNDTIRRWRGRLQSHRLIRVKRTPLGFRVWVQNSQKWPGRTLEKLKSECANLHSHSTSEPANLPPQSGQFCGFRVGNSAVPLKEVQSRTEQNRTAKQQPAAAAAAIDETFRQASQAYRKAIGRSFGFLGKKAAMWRELVSEHGPEVIIQAVELWTGELSSDGAGKLGSPVSVFLSQCAEFIDAAKSQDEKKTQSALHEAENQRRFDAAVKKHGAENVKWNDSPWDSMRVLVNVDGEWVPPEVADSVIAGHERQERERAERETQKLEAEIDRRFDEVMVERYGDRWTNGLVPPNEQEEIEVRKRIRNEVLEDKTK